MKNLFSSLIIVACIIFFVSCSSDPNKLIVGTWKITDMKSNQKIDEKTIEELKATMTYVYKADQSVEETGQTGIRKWSISKDGKTLETSFQSDGQSATIKQTIKELTSSKMVLEFVSGEVTTTFVLEKK